MYKRIRDLREDHDLTQTALANYLKCSQVCYSHYENGRRDIPTETLIQLAKFYSTSTDYLLGLTDQKEAYPNNTR
ncbi:MAG: helix-turn-helix transcriptional regulator [Faecalimonas sp.]|nr:helix-turn-helix transcriptional regulator [Faecalimonas sp.]